MNNRPYRVMLSEKSNSILTEYVNKHSFNSKADAIQYILENHRLPTSIPCAVCGKSDIFLDSEGICQRKSCQNEFGTNQAY